MDLGADMAAVLPALRRAAESRMVDHCIIEAIVDARDPDPATGVAAETRTTVYSGMCEFKAADTQARTADSAGRALVGQGATLKLPVDAPGSAAVRIGNVATITLASFNSQTVSIVARVTAMHDQTYATARRLPVEVTRNG